MSAAPAAVEPDGAAAAVDELAARVQQLAALALARHGRRGTRDRTVGLLDLTAVGARVTGALPVVAERAARGQHEKAKRDKSGDERDGLHGRRQSIRWRSAPCPLRHETGWPTSC
jgi:hypothetical protein